MLYTNYKYKNSCTWFSVIFVFEYNIVIFTSAMQEKIKFRFFHNRLFCMHVLLDKVGTRQHHCIDPPETDSKYSIGITKGRPTSHSYKLHQMHVCNIFYVSDMQGRAVPQYFVRKYLRKYFYCY